MVILKLIILLLFCCEVSCAEIDELRNGLSTNTREDDELLRELEDISNMLKRTTSEEEELATTTRGKTLDTDRDDGKSERETWRNRIPANEDEDLSTSREGTKPEAQAMLKDLDAVANDRQQADQHQVSYETVGCFKDNKVDPRPVPELLADLTGEVDWYHLDKVIQKCAELAHDKGYTHFGIQSFGQCMSGKNAASTYNRDGGSTGCQSGLGGPGENLVFTVISPQTSLPTTERTSTPPVTVVTTPLPTDEPTTIPSECTTYVTLDSARRSVNFNESVSSCDDKLQRGWYRFSGAAGNVMPTSCVPTHHCGAHAPGWLNGRHPTVHEGKVRREVCFHWKSCCSWRNSVLVRNCGEFYVYELSPPLSCDLRYCGNRQEPGTTSPADSTVATAKPVSSTRPSVPPATTTTSVSSPTPKSTPSTRRISTLATRPRIPPECLNYKLLNDASRAEGYSTKYRRPICDKTLPKDWYRFTGEAGDKMPDFCVAKLRCGTHAPGWLNITHPTVAHEIFNANVCFHWGTDCCYWSTEIRVRNCGGFFVYELHPAPYCSLRYCGNNRQVPVLTTAHTSTTSPPTSPTQPTECSSYRILSDGDRSQNYLYQSVQGAKPTCDLWLRTNWYRFTGLAGNRMPEKCVPTRRCGTLAPGWLQGAHPSARDGVVQRTVCFNWGRTCCRWRRKIFVRNCGDFYVYKLQNAPTCKLRYCGVGQNTEPGFAIICLPAGIQVHISRRSLPSLVDPSLLRLDDPRCGVIQMNNNNVMLATPLDSCGTTRRYPTGSPVLFLIRLLVTS